MRRLIASVVLVPLLACRPETADPPTPDGASAPADPTACATATLTALRDRDMARLAALAHPSRGIRFTSFGFVREDDVVLGATELRGAMSDPKIRDWGNLAESDERIRLPFAKYVASFVYDADFASIVPAAPGTRDAFEPRMDNVDVLEADLAAAHPGGRVVEYRHHPATSSDHDWRTLRVVCEEDAGRFYVVGLVHNQWSP